MAKIVLTSARDIALDKLVASDVNVRRIKAGVSVEDRLRLAERLPAPPGQQVSPDIHEVGVL